jgi:hypothetical protein
MINRFHSLVWLASLGWPLDEASWSTSLACLQQSAGEADSGDFRPEPKPTTYLRMS